MNAMVSNRKDRVLALHPNAPQPIKGWV